MTQPGHITRDMTLGEALRHVVAQRPQRTAMVDGDVQVTYVQLQARVHSLASNLRQMQIGKDSRIATLLWSGPEYVYLFFAAAELGAVIAPLPPRMRRCQMEDFLRELEPQLVVTSTEMEVPEGLETLQTLQRELTSLRAILVTDDPAQGKRDFKDLCHSHPGVRFVPERVETKDLFAILYTSGTTGRATGVMHSHRGLITPVAASITLREMWMLRFPSYRRLRRWLQALVRYGTRLLRAAGRQQVFLCTMGMHTIAGIEGMLQTLLMGDKLILLPRFHPLHALEAIQRERVSIYIGVPLTYIAMMQVEDFDRFNLSSLLICATGAAPCHPDLARQIKKRFHCAVHIGFGLTELGGGIAATSLEDSPVRQIETIGQPMPGMEVRIVDEDHHTLPPGEVGELACRSDSLMIDYFGDQRDREMVVDEEGWFYTGDLAVMDNKGYIRIVGRKKDMIIRGGQNIYPLKIESLLEKMEEVREAAVVGVPDKFGGESVWAFVIPEDGARVNVQSVLAHCRAHLEPYEIPQQVRLVKDFPRTSTQKARKFRIRQIAMEEKRSHDSGA
jgi:fatty-acyl-CoA synthase